jgi:ribosomal protein L24
MHLQIGDQVEVVGGKYVGKYGRIERLTPKMVQLDSLMSPIKQSSVAKKGSSPLSSTPSKTSESTREEISDELHLGDDVVVSGGKYVGQCGRVEKLTPQKVKLDQLENLIHRSSVTKTNSPLRAREVGDDIKPLLPCVMPKLNNEDRIEQINAVARDIFKISSVRPKQLEAIVAVLNGDDVMGVLPTGAGKSLIYQLPALMDERRGITVIISPLLALIQDQMSSLQELGLRAERYDGTVDPAKRAQVEAQISGFGQPAGSGSGASLHAVGEHPLFLFTTPETLVGSDKERLSKLLTRSGSLVRWVLDEAHCVTTWGHDFRPKYRMVAEHIRCNFRGIKPVIALTATAPELVEQDLQRHLLGEGREWTVVRDMQLRQNLAFNVTRVATAGEADEACISEVMQCVRAGKKAIVFCHPCNRCKTEVQRIYR